MESFLHYIIMGALAQVLLFGATPVESFIKAAIGLRLGYSPTEKGYGEPLQWQGLHSKVPALKGQFLTGVHGKPKEGSHHGAAAAPGGGAGSGLLRHLKILGVNLYLGGPKGKAAAAAATHGDKKESGRSQAQSLKGSPQLIIGGQNTQYGYQHGANDEHELFYPEASQYPTSYTNGLVMQGQQGRGNVLNEKPRGFSLASLMSGPQWGQRSWFRLPPLFPFMRGPTHPQNTHPTGPIVPQYSTIYSTVLKDSGEQSRTPQFQDNPPNLGHGGGRGGGATPTTPLHPHPPQQQFIPYIQRPQMVHLQLQPQSSELLQHYPPTTFPAQQYFLNAQPSFRASSPPVLQYNPNGDAAEVLPAPEAQRHYEEAQSPQDYNNQQPLGDSPLHAQEVEGMPEEFRPPEGFQYSHTDTSPILSMGMSTYDDPPVLMRGEREEDGGKGEEAYYPQQSSQIPIKYGPRTSSSSKMEGDYALYLSAGGTPIQDFAVTKDDKQEARYRGALSSSSTEKRGEAEPQKKERVVRRRRRTTTMSSYS